MSARPDDPHHATADADNAVAPAAPAATDSPAAPTSADDSPGRTPNHDGPDHQPASADTSSRKMLCPYCGHLSRDRVKCDQCGGLFEPLSRQATQNAMGPWQIRDKQSPFAPGCSYRTLRGMVAKGKITPDTIVRGPTTRQFWCYAKKTPGVAVLLGVCHACEHTVDPGDLVCGKCGVTLGAPNDRQYLGLLPSQPLPGTSAAQQRAALQARNASGTRAGMQAVKPTQTPAGGSNTRDGATHARVGAGASAGADGGAPAAGGAASSSAPAARPGVPTSAPTSASAHSQTRPRPTVQSRRKTLEVVVAVLSAACVLLLIGLIAALATG